MVNVKENYMSNNLSSMTTSLSGKKNQQRGIVLVVALVFLIALTAVAGALMQNTTTDVKMAGASEEKVIAMQEAISAVDEVIFNQVSPGAINEFAASVNTFANGDKDISAAIPVSNANNDFASATLNVSNNQFMKATACPRAKDASSNDGNVCNLLMIQVTRTYGRNNTSSIVVNSGILQQLRP